MVCDGLFVMAVSGIYDYHATKVNPKCSLVWMASCFVIPPSLKCRHLGTWDEIADELHRLENDIERETIMPRMLTHAELHHDSQDTESYRLSPEHIEERNEEHIQNKNELELQYEDPIDDYLAEYAEIIASRDDEEAENYQEVQTRPQGITHEERRRTYVRRKSCSDVSRTGLSLSLSLPQDTTVDDLHVGGKPQSPSKPDKFNLRGITEMARRMSIPILDKSEDVDHGTKVYGEQLVKKSRNTKQFREAFSEEHDDYIPHRAPKTSSKSLTASDIENTCKELKSETPGSYKNVVTELKLRTTDYSEHSHLNDKAHKNTENVYTELTTSEYEGVCDDYKMELPLNYGTVVREIQQRTKQSNGQYNVDAYDGNDLDHSLSESLTSDSSHTSHSLRRNKTLDLSPAYNSRTQKLSDSFKDDRLSKTLPSSDCDAYPCGSSTPRSRTDDLRPVYNPHTQRLSDSLKDDRFSKTLPSSDCDAYPSGSSTPRSKTIDLRPAYNPRSPRLSDSLKENRFSKTLPSGDVDAFSNGYSTPRRNTIDLRPAYNPHSQRLSDSFREDRFSKTLPSGDVDAYSSGSSTPRSNNHDQSPRNRQIKQKHEEPVSDFMKKLTNLTAQTRLATRPSLGNGESYDQSPSNMMRSQSVMNVSSPAAMSPKHERNLLSSSFSSSTSSQSSDIPVVSYHNVVDPCYRCWKTVYSLDKVGPIRKVLYHKQCFRCVSCNTLLSLNTYRQNVNDKSDVQVYCKKHVPTQESPRISLDDRNLNVMMHHPKLDSVNTNIRGSEEERRKSRNIHPLIIGRAVSTPRLDLICGPNETSDSNNTSSLDRNGNVTLRELKMEDTPRSVWSRSSFSAAKLDLTVPASARTGSSLYRTVDTWNYL